MNTERAKEIADAIVAEILTVPELCAAKNFSELHDFCDANELGGMAEMQPDDGAGQESYIDDCNAAMEIVNAWLAARNA
jgi:hypothetical protein